MLTSTYGPSWPLFDCRFPSPNPFLILLLKPSLLTLSDHNSVLLAHPLAWPPEFESFWALLWLLDPLRYSFQASTHQLLPCPSLSCFIPEQVGFIHLTCQFPGGAAVTILVVLCCTELAGFCSWFSLCSGTWEASKIFLKWEDRTCVCWFSLGFMVSWALSALGDFSPLWSLKRTSLQKPSS